MRAARGSSFPRRAERGTARAAAPLARPAGAAAWEESPCRRGAAPGVDALGQRPVPVPGSPPGLADRPERLHRSHRRAARRRPRRPAHRRGRHARDARRSSTRSARRGA